MGFKGVYIKRTCLPDVVTEQESGVVYKKRFNGRKIKERAVEIRTKQSLPFIFYHEKPRITKESLSKEVSRKAKVNGMHAIH